MIKKSMILIGLTVLCLGYGLGYGAGDRALSASSTELGLKKYTAMYATTPITIDGNLEEPAWKVAKNINFIMPHSHKKPISPTVAKITWDDRFVYVGFEAADKDLYSYFTERDDETCYEDVVEFFFNTNPMETPYYNFEVNTLGTVYDAFSLKYGEFAGGIRRWMGWNCEGLKVAVKIDGTLNDWSDVDKEWSLEMAIPFKSLRTLKGKTPKSGDAWKFHVARYDYSVYLPKGKEISSCVPFFKGNFHNQETWIPLIFK